MPELQREFLQGSPYEQWLLRCEEEFDNIVDPLCVYQVNGENVVWVRRIGETETEGEFDIYHIGCDHLGYLKPGDDHLKAMLGCKTLQKVLMDQGMAMATEVYDLPRSLPIFSKKEAEQIVLDDTGRELVAKFIPTAIRLTMEEPETCKGNIRNGVFARPILKKIMGDVDDIQLNEILAELDQQNEIHVHDPLVWNLAA
jgi:hypothetical protein